jgi:hypothetical protein
MGGARTPNTVSRRGCAAVLAGAAVWCCAGERSIDPALGRGPGDEGGAGPGLVLEESRFAWGENIGWLNARDADAGRLGVQLDATYLSGLIWAENVGWISVGLVPQNGVSYTNSTGDDCGVNVDPVTGALSGLAWGENIGWIVFTLEGLEAAQRPRVDRAVRPARLRGWAWGENVGWINLDAEGPGQFVAFDRTPWGPGPCSIADVASTDGTPGPDGRLDNGDFSLFLASFFSAACSGPPSVPCAPADIAGTDTTPGPDGWVDNGDFSAFIASFFAGCP